jgi:hypothetical protein
VREQQLNDLKWRAHCAELETKMKLAAMGAGDWDELPF